MFTSTATSGTSFHVRRRRDSGGDQGGDDDFAWFRDRKQNSGLEGFGMTDEPRHARRRHNRRRRQQPGNNRPGRQL